MTLRLKKVRPAKSYILGRGFSLPEILVAMAVLAMLGALSYGTFARAMDARDRATAITTYYQDIRQSLLRMSREVSMAYISSHRACDEPRTRTLFKADGSFGGMRLDFTSFSHVRTQRDANESDQNELSYYLDQHPEKSDVRVLMRREQKRIDEEPDEGGHAQVLLEDVESLSFEFYNENTDRWVEEWDSDNYDQRGRLPLFVTIKIGVKNSNGESETFQTKTRIFLRNRLKILGTGFAGCIDD